jgi:hypothetical protein
MNAEYTRHAYRRAVWAELGRLLLDRYLSTDNPPSAQILCEEVFRSPREVPEDVILEIADRLRAYASEEEHELLRFELRKREGADPALPGPRKPTKAIVKKK